MREINNKSGRGKSIKVGGVNNKSGSGKSIKVGRVNYKSGRGKQKSGRGKL